MGDWVAEYNEGGVRWGVDSCNPDNESGRYTNHSMTPNAEFLVPNAGTYDTSINKYYLIVMSITMIECNEEIFVNYGIPYFEHNNEIDAACFTGLPKLIRLI